MAPVSPPVATGAAGAAASSCLVRVEACRAAGDRRGQAAALFEAGLEGHPEELWRPELCRLLGELGTPAERLELACADPLQLAAELVCTEEWGPEGYRADRKRRDSPTRPRGGWGLPVAASLRRHSLHSHLVAFVLWTGPLASFLLGRQLTAFAELRYLPWPLALGLSCAFIPSLLVLSIVVATGIRRLVRSISAWSLLRRARVRVEAKSRRMQYRWCGGQQRFRNHFLLHAVRATYVEPQGLRGVAVDLVASPSVWYALRVGQQAPVWFIDGHEREPSWSRYQFQTEWNLESRRGPVAVPLIVFGLLAAFTGLFGAVVVAVVQALL